MRWVLALVFVTAASYTYAQPSEAEVLITQAERYGAPFTQTSLKRIVGDGWGVHRSNDSIDAVIFNMAGKSFENTESNCINGSYANDLLPELIIPRGKSSVFGVDSTKYKLGVQCVTKYMTRDLTSWISMVVFSPFQGFKFANASSSDDLAVAPTFHFGKNKQVRFMVRSRQGHLSRESAGSSGYYNKVKRVFNKFVKSSKSGTSVRYI